MVFLSIMMFLSFNHTDINECSSNPCLNGAACVDQVNGYVCNCLAGYAGIHCQTSECTSHVFLQMMCTHRHFGDGMKCSCSITTLVCLCSCPNFYNLIFKVSHGQLRFQGVIKKKENAFFLLGRSMLCVLVFKAGCLGSIPAGITGPLGLFTALMNYKECKTLKSFSYH